MSFNEKPLNYSSKAISWSLLVSLRSISRQGLSVLGRYEGTWTNRVSPARVELLDDTGASCKFEEEERCFSYIHSLTFSEFCNIDNLTTRFDFPAVGVTWAVSFPWVGTPAIANLNTSNYSPLITADEHSRLLYTGEPLYKGFRAPSSFFTGWLVCLSGRARNVILITVLVLMRIDILMIF